MDMWFWAVFWAACMACGVAAYVATEWVLDEWVDEDGWEP